MFSEYFNPVKTEIIDYVNKLDNNQLGSKLKINGRDNLKSFEALDVVIFSINEYRFNSSIQKSFNANKDFRKKLYSLYYGKWDLNIYDFGDLENGNKISDTQFALEKIIEFFSKNQILVLTIGGSQNLLYNIYSSQKQSLQKINLVSVDNKIDFSENDESFLSKIIMDDNNKLENFSNIGFQKHLSSVPENKLIDKMYFESINLGKIKANINEAEPVLRDSNIVSFNINCVKSGDLNNAHQYIDDGSVSMKRGGKVKKKSKSRVNEAGNYTKPGLRKRIFNRIKAGGKGGAPGQWSARKAQMMAKAYKKAGGGYRD